MASMIFDYLGSFAADLRISVVYLEKALSLYPNVGNLANEQTVFDFFLQILAKILKDIHWRTTDLAASTSIRVDRHAP